MIIAAQARQTTRHALIVGLTHGDNLALECLDRAGQIYGRTPVSSYRLVAVGNRVFEAVGSHIREVTSPRCPS